MKKRENINRKKKNRLKFIIVQIIILIYIYNTSLYQWRGEAMWSGRTCFALLCKGWRWMARCPCRDAHNFDLDVILKHVSLIHISSCMLFLFGRGWCGSVIEFYALFYLFFLALFWMNKGARPNKLQNKTCEFNLII